MKKAVLFKPEGFKTVSPEVSVVLPIYKGKRSPHLTRLLAELKRQTFQNFEVIVVEGVSRNGRARNEGVRQALGQWLVFIDETSSLGGEKVLENLLEPFLSAAFDPQNVGMTGASVIAHPATVKWQKQYEMARDFMTPVVKVWTESERVQHPCLAIPKYIYYEVGWESDLLISGTDNDLRERVKKAGYKMMLAPDTFVYYLPPSNKWDVLTKGFKKGMGAAYAFLVFPGLFEPPKIFGRKVTNRLVMLFYKILTIPSRLFQRRCLANPFFILYEWFVAAGFIAGWFKWFYMRPCKDRVDLPADRGEKPARPES